MDEQELGDFETAVPLKPGSDQYFFVEPLPAEPLNNSEGAPLVPRLRIGTTPWKRSAEGVEIQGTTIMNVSVFFQHTYVLATTAGEHRSALEHGRFSLREKYGSHRYYVADQWTGILPENELFKVCQVTVGKALTMYMNATPEWVVMSRYRAYDLTRKWMIREKERKHNEIKALETEIARIEEKGIVALSMCNTLEKELTAKGWFE